MANKIISTAISAVIALGACNLNAATAVAQPAQNTQQNSMQHMAMAGMEQCYGIAKAGMNDCAAANSSCGGQSKMDGDKTVWIAVPTGLCNKLVGGNLKSVG